MHVTSWGNQIMDTGIWDLGCGIWDLVLGFSYTP